MSVVGRGGEALLAGREGGGGCPGKSRKIVHGPTAATLTSERNSAFCGKGPCNLHT